MQQTNIDHILVQLDEKLGSTGARAIERLKDSHPEHVDVISDFASYRFVFENGAVYNSDCITDEAVDAAIGRAEQIRLQLTAAHVVTQSAATAKPITSIVDAAKQLGLSIPALAGRLRVTPLIVVKANQRLLNLSSIPRAFVSALAEALNTTSESVAGYLSRPPTLSPQASYKADAAPRLGAQLDFQSAIDADRDLSPADKDYWRALTKGGDTELEG